MKQTLLFLFLTGLVRFAGAQANVHTGNSEEGDFISNSHHERLALYPNPATQFIRLQGAEQVRRVVIYNLVGKELKDIRLEEGRSDERLDISDLQRGLYLVQLLNARNQVLSTLRLNKK